MQIFGIEVEELSTRKGHEWTGYVVTPETIMTLCSFYGLKYSWSDLEEELTVYGERTLYFAFIHNELTMVCDRNHCIYQNNWL